jgi:hypothetical protein
VGTAVTAGDSATLSSGNNPTGSVFFTLYSDAACTISVTGMSGSGAISSGGASWSSSWTPTALGTYHWQASYAGDANNHASTTACGDPNEQIVVSAVGIAKRVVEIRSVSPGTYDVTLEMLVENYGDVPLTNVQVIDNLATTFPLPTTFTVQSLTSADFAINWQGYNGSSNTDLLKRSKPRVHLPWFYVSSRHWPDPLITRQSQPPRTPRGTR